MAIKENLPLFERLGGSEAIMATVSLFYSKVMADESLVPFFEGIDIERLIKKQIGFMTIALGGAGTYHGLSLVEAHAPLLKKGLNDQHFDSVAKHLEETLKELNVPNELIYEALEIVSGTRDEILGR